MNKQLYYLPEEDRTITRNGLAAEIEYIGGEYASFVDSMIDDMIESGLAIEIGDGDPFAEKAEPEERTILIAKLFTEMRHHEDVMKEWKDDEYGLLDELREMEDDALEYYQNAFLLCDL